MILNADDFRIRHFKHIEVLKLWRGPMETTEYIQSTGGISFRALLYAGAVQNQGFDLSLEAHSALASIIATVTRRYC